MLRIRTKSNILHVERIAEGGALLITQGENP